MSAAEDWMGEGLIRSEKKERDTRGVVAPYGVCKADGCDRQLSSVNRTGVCRAHRHKGRRYTTQKGPGTKQKAKVEDVRPSRCRYRLKDAGEAHPRSSCEACGRSVSGGLACPYIAGS